MSILIKQFLETKRNEIAEFLDIHCDTMENNIAFIFNTIDTNGGDKEGRAELCIMSAGTNILIEEIIRAMILKEDALKESIKEACADTLTKQDIIELLIKNKIKDTCDCENCKNNRENIRKNKLSELTIEDILGTDDDH